MTQSDWRVCGFCGQPLSAQTRSALSGIQQYGTTFQQRVIPRWAIWAGGGILVLVVILLAVAVAFHLPGRLTGRYDTVAEKMPASTDVYVGINLLEVIQMQDSEQIGMLGIPIMAIFGEDLQKFSNLSGPDTGEFDIQAAISSILLAETGLDLNEDILPWAGQYAGIGIEVNSDEFGYDSNDENVILAMEARNSKAADDFLKKLSLNLENRQDDISEYEYEGVLIYSASGRYGPFFARVEDLVAFSPTEATLLSLIDNIQKNQTLGDDPIYKKLVSQTPSGTLARLYINGMSVGDVMYGEFRGGMGLFSQVFSSPVAAAAEGTLVSLSVDKDKLRFDSLMAFDAQQLRGQDLDWVNQQSDLFSLVPEDALIVFGGYDLGQSWRNFSQIAGIDGDLSDEIGFNITSNLFDFLDEEWLVAISPAQDGLLYKSRIPLGGAFLSHSNNDPELQRTISTFNRFVIQEGGVQIQPHSFLDGDLYEVTERRGDREMPMIAYCATDGYLFFGTSSQSIQDLYGNGDRLVDTPRYQQVTNEMTSGARQTFYLDVIGLFQYLEQTGARTDLDDLKPYMKYIAAVVAAQNLAVDDIMHSELILLSNKQ